MGLCESCKNNPCGYASEDVIRCGDFEENFVQTNADRIRAMSDEELAKEYDNRIYCGGCPVREKCDKTLDLCDTLLLEWLKQPAK